MGSAQTKPGQNEATYRIIAKTSKDNIEAGTDDSVSVRLSGNNETTEWLILDEIGDDFKNGARDTFKVTALDVGLPTVLEIKIDGTDSWYCDWIKVKLNGFEIKFTIYDWVEKHLIVTSEGVLPQHVTNEEVKRARAQQVNEHRIKFPWIPRAQPGDLTYGLPRYVNATNSAELPKIFQRKTRRSVNLIAIGAANKLSELHDTLINNVFPLTNLDSYHDIYINFEREHLHRNTPRFLKDWKSDECMGWQTLNGIATNCFEKCTEIPAHFNVLESDVVGLLREGKSLQDEMKEGRVYISDYHELLNDVERSHDLICPNSVALFYVNAEDNFVPIVIQLKAGDREYLFTANEENSLDWLLAKMFYRIAQSDTHEWIYHFLLTHNACEPFAVSVFRCFPLCHPVFKLLKPHLVTVPAINTDARNTLITPTASAATAIAISAGSLAKKWYKTFTVEEMVLPKSLRRRGVDDMDLLPKFHYRHDALRVWAEIEKYVTGVLNYFYKSNKDVVGDFELQEWINDTALQGFGWQDGDTKGLPTKLDTLEQLIEICTGLIFTSTAQHAAVNFGQFDTYKFVPNAPLAARLPAHKKGEATLQRIMNTLPDYKMSVTAMSTISLLSVFTLDEVFLGQYPERLFEEPSVVEIQNSFKSGLDVLQSDIMARNQNLEKPYIYLNPKSIPNGIAI